MTEPTPDLDARLARLAARKAGARAATPTGTSEQPSARATERAAEHATPSARATRTRRRHPAAAARILSLGLSSSAFFSMVAAFGQQTTWSAPPVPVSRARTVTTIPRPAPRAKVIVKDVHHIVFTDRYGRPIPASSVPKGAPIYPKGSLPPAGLPPVPSASANQQRSTWSPPPSAAPTVNVPAPAAPAPAPAPSAPAAPTPPPTAPPPVVTTPPPPPPPACSGSTCP